MPPHGACSAKGQRNEDDSAAKPGERADEASEQGARERQQREGENVHPPRASEVR